MPKRPSILVIDPAVKNPELESFNLLARMSELPVTYHLPALYGFNSLEGVKDSVKGIVILGSLSSVNDTLPWQLRLKEFLNPFIHNKTPLLGLCFGHQFIAHLFGAKVEYVTPEKNKFLGFRTVNLKSNRLWGADCTGPLYVSHNEQVVTVPAHFEISATSKEVVIDGLSHLHLPIWTFQPHPEAGTKFLELREKRLASDPSQFHFGHGLLDKFLSYCAHKQ